MSNKTPYEIRLDLLAMAKEYMDAVQQINMEFAKNAFTKAVEANAASAKDWEKFIPQTYTVQELMDKANEMYSFVSNTTKTPKN